MVKPPSRLSGRLECFLSPKASSLSCRVSKLLSLSSFIGSARRAGEFAARSVLSMTSWTMLCISVALAKPAGLGSALEHRLKSGRGGRSLCLKRSANFRSCSSHYNCTTCPYFLYIERCKIRFCRGSAAARPSPSLPALLGVLGHAERGCIDESEQLSCPDQLPVCFTSV